MSLHEPPSRAQPSIGYWFVTALLLLWGLAYAGLVVFYLFAGAEHWAGLVAQGRILPEYAAYIARIPLWVKLLTLGAAISRLTAGVGLMLRHRWSVALYGISLACVTVIMFRGFVIADVASVIRPSQVWVEALFMALSVFAFWFSLRARKNGYLALRRQWP